MTLLSDENNEVSTGIGLCKNPIFDGERRSELKNWWSNMLYTLEMSGLEESTTNEWKGINILTKESNKPEIAEDEGAPDMNEVTKGKKSKLRYREVKKAKSHEAKVTKDNANHLSADANTHCEAYATLKEKWFVSKVC